MKNRHLFSILICTISMLMISACEKAEIQKSIARIDNRTNCVDDCSDCPVEDCCCSVTALSGGFVGLTFCGVDDPCVSSIPCSATVNGCNISGSEFTGSVNFTGGDFTELFCVPKGSAFSIQPSMGSTGTARITCQVGQFSPQYVNVTWNAPNKVYYTASDACVLTSCF